MHTRLQEPLGEGKWDSEAQWCFVTRGQRQQRIKMIKHIRKSSEVEEFWSCSQTLYLSTEDALMFYDFLLLKPTAGDENIFDEG